MIETAELYQKIGRVLDVIKTAEADYTYSSRVFVLYMHLLRTADIENTSLKDVYVVRNKTQQVIADELNISRSMISLMFKILKKTELIHVIKPTGEQRLEHESQIYVISPPL